MLEITPIKSHSRKRLPWSEVTFAEKEKYRTSLRIKRKTQLVISRLDFPHLIFYLRLAFLAPIGYPVICTCPPADICEQGEKNFTAPFSRGSWERNACRSPTTSFKGLFSYKLEALRLSPKMASRFFFFLEWKCKGIKRRFRKPNQAKEHIKKDSNRYLVGQFKISEGLGNH